MAHLNCQNRLQRIANPVRIIQLHNAINLTSKEESTWVQILTSQLKLKWAWDGKTKKITCSPSKDSGQPGHLPSLIRVFHVRFKKPRILSYPLNAQFTLVAQVILFILSCDGPNVNWFCPRSLKILSNSIKRAKIEVCHIHVPTWFNEPRRNHTCCRWSNIFSLVHQDTNLQLTFWTI